MEVTITFNPLAVLAFMGCTVLFLLYILWMFKAELEQRLSVFQETIRKSAVDIFASFVSQVLRKPEVHDSLTNIIAAGITTWVEGDGQVHVTGIIDAKNQKKVAREIGKQLPSMVSGVAQGVVDSMNPFRRKTCLNDENSKTLQKDFRMSGAVEDDGTAICGDD